MARGVPKGENRFKASQDAKIAYRLNRIDSVVIPRLKTLSANVKISSINKYAKLVCDLYNDNLPINDKPLTVRTVTSNEEYWKKLGYVYHSYFAKDTDKEEFKKQAIAVLDTHELEDLKIRIETLESENKSLKTAFKQISGTKDINLIAEDENSSLIEIDNLCRIIYALVEFSDGIIDVDADSGTIRNQADDLEKPEGMLPKETVKPYIEWLKNRNRILGDFS